VADTSGKQSEPIELIVTDLDPEDVIERVVTAFENDSLREKAPEIQADLGTLKSESLNTVYEALGKRYASGQLSLGELAQFRRVLSEAPGVSSGATKTFSYTVAPHIRESMGGGGPHGANQSSGSAQCGGVKFTLFDPKFNNAAEENNAVNRFFDGLNPFPELLFHGRGDPVAELPLPGTGSGQDKESQSLMKKSEYDIAQHFLEKAGLQMGEDGSVCLPETPRGAELLAVMNFAEKGYLGSQSNRGRLNFEAIVQAQEGGVSQEFKEEYYETAKNIQSGKFFAAIQYLAEGFVTAGAQGAMSRMSARTDPPPRRRRSPATGAYDDEIPMKREPGTNKVKPTGLPKSRPRRSNNAKAPQDESQPNRSDPTRVDNSGMDKSNTGKTRTPAPTRERSKQERSEGATTPEEKMQIDRSDPTRFDFWGAHAPKTRKSRVSGLPREGSGQWPAKDPQEALTWFKENYPKVGKLLDERFTADEQIKVAKVMLNGWDPRSALNDVEQMNNPSAQSILPHDVTTRLDIHSSAVGFSGHLGAGDDTRKRMQALLESKSLVDEVWKVAKKKNLPPEILAQALFETYHRVEEVSKATQILKVCHQAAQNSQLESPNQQQLRLLARDVLILALRKYDGWPLSSKPAPREAWPPERGSYDFTFDPQYERYRKMMEDIVAQEEQKGEMMPSRWFLTLVQFSD